MENRLINIIRSIPPIVYVVRKIRELIGISSEDLHLAYYKKRQSLSISEYLSENSLRKLSIGAQNNSIDGWLNVDIIPRDDKVVYMDATKVFPFSDESFDYVFSEHMIEHISFEEAGFMLQECFRVLKQGGKIRIATPDAEALAKVILNPELREHVEYVEYYMKRFFTEDVPKNPVFVLNKLFYGFHHRFIHNESSLEFLLRSSGFSYLGRKDIGMSDDSELRDIEQHWKELGILPNRVETIVVEAIKNA